MILFKHGSTLLILVLISIITFFQFKDLKITPLILFMAYHYHQDRSLELLIVNSSLLAVYLVIMKAFITSLLSKESLVFSLDRKKAHRRVLILCM